MTRQSGKAFILSHVMTRQGKGKAFILSLVIEDLELELVNALYEQRSHEEVILSCNSNHQMIPEEAKSLFYESKAKVKAIEYKIRFLKHGY